MHLSKQIVISLYHKLKTYFMKKNIDIFYINQKKLDK